jgi:3-phenylpropionate/cinnamic acid dioxygenase small subunit
MNSGILSEADLAAFVYQEARLIDEKRFVEWYDLFTEDGLYWMPLTRDQPDGRLHNSLLYEDRLLLRLRIERLAKPNSFSQAQRSFCQHVLQQPRLESRDEQKALYVMRTPFLYTESQGDRQQTYAGVAWHHLVSLDEGLRVRMKRIELLNRDAALPSIQLFL